MSERLPAVGRPRGDEWAQLVAEGVRWEGQVLIVGDQFDLAARAIVTDERIALCRGGGIVLEAARAWLDPMPRMRTSGEVILSIWPPDIDQPERITLTVPEGFTAAEDLLFSLRENDLMHVPSGSPAQGQPASEGGDLPLYVAGPVGADGPGRRRSGRRKAAPMNEQELLGLLALLDADDFPSTPATARQPGHRWNDSPNTAAALPASTDGQTYQPRELGNFLGPIGGLEMRRERASRRQMIVRLGGLMLLLVSVLALGSGKLPIGRNDGESVVTVDDTDTQPVAAAPTAMVVDPTATLIPPPPTSSAASVGSAKMTPVPYQTAVVLGVGGETGSEDVTEPAATEPPATQPAKPTSTPTRVSPPPTPRAATTPVGETAEVASTGDAAPVEPAATAPATQAAPTTAPEVTQPAAPAANAGTAPAGIGITLVSAARAESMQELTLAPVRGKEWVAINLEITNTSTGSLSIPLSGITVSPVGSLDGAVAPDSASGMVGSFLGMMPDYTTASPLALAPGEAAEVVLVYLVDPGVGDLQMNVNGQGVGLAQVMTDAETVAGITP